MSEQDNTVAGRGEPVAPEDDPNTSGGDGVTGTCPASGNPPERKEGDGATRLARRQILQAAVGLASAGAASQGSAAISRHASSGPRPTREAVRRGVDYLARTQAADGSWQRYPGITALAVMALASA